MEKTLCELAEHVGGTVAGNGDLKIKGVMTIDDAEEGYITFVSNRKYLSKIKETKASAVIVSPEFKNYTDKPLLVTENPYLAFAKIVDLMMNPVASYPKTIDPSSRISPTAKLGQNVSIYANVFVGNNTTINDHVVLYPGVYIGDNCQIDEDTIIYPNVVIYNDSIIGKRVTIHSNTVIGSDGFGYAPDGEKYYKIPQVGITVIEDDVDIGANTTINRGALGETRIKKGTKIDSQVIISHNVEVGENTLIVSQVGIAGTVKIGKHATLAGQVGIVGHVIIGDNVTVGGQSGVASDIPSGKTYLGSPAIPIKVMRKCYTIIPMLPEMRNTIMSLEKRLAELENKK
ncbi:MAG: UDP-3-O-(3-hydroxymyristoyl)glucosamine N-acyltransferase [Planctomycetes bacterium]|nr:UDP-3-O-(3-hydroxymyristoyl)glucosamine N-acyltransferase [Planctomycetota bacterium]MBI4007190.1 UDP-3-O-(3-hydroxymyristoyl)glucosamine N-acyltransferase [Planctomycetota bacterium]